jgi:hypothetical protein
MSGSTRVHRASSHLVHGDRDQALSRYVERDADAWSPNTAQAVDSWGRTLHSGFLPLAASARWKAGALEETVTGGP